MNNERFIKIREEFDTYCTRLLKIKQQEYSSNEDRFSQIKLAATLQNEHPCKTITNFMIKHEVSIHSMINLIDNDTAPDYSFWEEKLGDLRNYCDLLFALIIEDLEEKEKR